MKKYGPDERGREAVIVIKHEAPEVPRWHTYEEAQKQAEKVKAQSDLGGCRRNHPQRL